MHQISNPAGRIIVFRVFPPFSDETGTAAAIELRSLIVAAPDKVIVITDLRDAQVFTQTTSDRFLAIMKADNPKIERSAILLQADSPTVMMQTARVVREANNPARATFTDRAALEAWLAPVLSPEERTALVTTLDLKMHKDA